jgi:penicillin-binding protein 1A
MAAGYTAGMGNGAGPDWDDDLIGINMNDADPRRRAGKKPTARAKRGGKGGGGDQRERIWRVARLVLGGLLAAGALGLFVLSGLFLYFGSDPKLPNLKRISDYKPKQQTRVLDRNGKPIGILGGGERRTVVPFETFPKHLINAVVAAEDPKFWEHEGIDYVAFARAAAVNLFSGRAMTGNWGQGGSTITQQVVKSLLLSREKSLRRKFQEMILARRLSQQLSKQDVLTIYLNDINYGEGNYGAESAAQYYFGKSIKDADLGESAFLAGVPQRPERHSPHKNPEAAKNRQMYVLRQMVEHKYIDKATADKLAKQPIEVQPPSRSETGFAGEAVGAVYKQLAEKYGAEAVPTLGVRVKTTIDLNLQKLARESLERGLENLDQRQGYRGPSGHHDGPKLAQYRYELKLAREIGRGGDEGKQAAAAAARSKRPLRYNLRPIRDADVLEGVVDAVKKTADPKQGQLLVDIGGRQGTVDISFEHRYTRHPKPLLDRFRPGDLVRVRLAPERRKGNDPSKETPLALELGPQAAMVVMDPRAREVLALVGGYNYRPGGWDRSQRASRQPGSSFKPFVYAAAIESGKFTAASMVNDAPEVYDLWKPQNYEKQAFRGPMRLRTAFADSVNTVAIRVLADVGLPPVIDLATRAGITTPMPKDVGLSLALGTNTVTPLELANAFATFVAAGERAPWRMVTAVNDEPMAPTEAPAAAMKPETAYVMISLMRSVVEQGTARAAAARIRRPIAGKTGTSSESKDAWFVGFSPDLLAAVWIGFDDAKTLGAGEAGGRTAVPIWTDFMVRALADRPTRDFTPPPAITTVRIDPATGLLPAPGSEGIDEVFIEGTAPRETAVTRDESATADQQLFEGTPPPPQPPSAPASP